MTDTIEHKETTPQEGAESQISRPLPVLKLNPDEYREDLAEFNLTREQEDELLRTLWNILSTFVDLGWGVGSVQYLLPEIFGKAGQDSANLLEEKDSKNHFNSAVQQDKQAQDEKGKSS